jgi:hypothetical protein
MVRLVVTSDDLKSVSGNKYIGGTKFEVRIVNAVGPLNFFISVLNDSTMPTWNLVCMCMSRVLADKPGGLFTRTMKILLRDIARPN